MTESIKRRFVLVGGKRLVHYRRAGRGSPVVLIHGSPSSSRAVVPLMERLAGRHTVFAFDSPGFGESDPLPLDFVEIEDLAEAVAATLRALKMPKYALYGTHTGACIALEVARRYPARVSGVVLDGLPIFSKAMTREILANYLPPFRPTWDGSHLAGYWTRVRDQSAWFPWYRRERATISPREFATPEALHESFMDFCRSGDNYRRGYSAAFRYDVRRAARALRVPATFMARDDDMLYPHLDLLPKLRRGQTIERHGSARDPYLDAMAAAVRRHARPGRPPADPGLQPRRGRVTKSYVDLDHGQVVVRAVVDAKKGRPLLLLHDGRSSSAMLEPLLLEFGRSRRVYAIELPGNGDSDPLPGQPTIADYARAVGAAMARLRLSSVDVYGQASGGSVAIELAASEPRSVRRLVLHGVNLFPAAERRRLAANYTPPIEVQWHGGHLYATWLMLRDDQVFFPWFDRRRTARRLIDGSWDAETLHRRAVEVLKARRTYHLLTQAAFRYDVAGRLPKVRATTLVAAEKGHVLERFSPAAMALARNGRQVTLPGTTRGMVRVINAFLTT